MNILLIKHFVVGFIVSEIPRVSVFGYFPLHIKLNKYIFEFKKMYITNLEYVYLNIGKTRKIFRSILQKIFDVHC